MFFIIVVIIVIVVIVVIVVTVVIVVIVVIVVFVVFVVFVVVGCMYNGLLPGGAENWFTMNNFLVHYFKSLKPKTFYPLGLQVRNVA